MLTDEQTLTVAPSSETTSALSQKGNIKKRTGPALSAVPEPAIVPQEQRGGSKDVESLGDNVKRKRVREVKERVSKSSSYSSDEEEDNKADLGESSSALVSGDLLEDSTMLSSTTTTTLKSENKVALIA